MSHTATPATPGRSARPTALRLAAFTQAVGVALVLSAARPADAPAQRMGDARIDRFQRSAAAAPGVNPLVGAPSARTDAIAYINFVSEHVDPMWARLFAGAGVSYAAPRVLVVATRQDVRSLCGKVGESSGPAYCDADRTVYLPADFSSMIANDRELTPGNFAPAYVIAHEWGHHVQNLYGLRALRERFFSGAFGWAYTRLPSGSPPWTRYDTRQSLNAAWSVAVTPGYYYAVVSQVYFDASRQWVSQVESAHVNTPVGQPVAAAQWCQA
ncbi:MAG: neutral zinc metallopeptidase [Gemmatimonadaceae bacterium]